MRSNRSIYADVAAAMLHGGNSESWITPLLHVCAAKRGFVSFDTCGVDLLCGLFYVYAWLSMGKRRNLRRPCVLNNVSDLAAAANKPRPFPCKQPPLEMSEVVMLAPSYYLENE